MNYKSLARVIMALTLVVAVAAGLWFASPTKALDIDIDNPSSGTTGTTYTFSVNITLSDPELLPIQSIDLKIYNINNSSLYDEYLGLPLATTSDYVSYLTSGTGVDALIKTTAEPNWTYSYGYRTVTWNGTPYNFGYGYGYGSVVTSIKYDIQWTPPSGWQGDYKIEAKITANGETFPKTSTFTLSAPSPPPPPGGGPGGGGGAPPTPGCSDIREFVTSGGVFRQDVTAISEDGMVELFISEDTTGKEKDGSALAKICIIPVEEPPAPPLDASIIGLVYSLGPEGATFNPAITLTITYDPAVIPEGHLESSTVIAIWDEITGEWIALEGCVVDTTNHIITLPLSNFTNANITILAYPSPAAFTAKTLTISPAEVLVGESVTISVTVTNTGYLEGTHIVTLEIDGEVVASQSVTLAGGASQEVSFTTSRDTAGTYQVRVNGLPGSFTVTALPPELQPAAFTTSALTIYPTEVEIGESTTITVMVTNTGDLDGTYMVTLMIDGVVVDTKDVTLAGGASQTVTFTTSMDAAGTYTVNVDELSDTFTVRELEIPPTTSHIWWIIGGVIGFAIAAGIVTWLIIQHRRLEYR